MKVRLSRNFTLDELACKCGCTTTIENINPYLVQQLQKLRDSFGLPIPIASGYRCEKHNKAVGGAPESQHVKGRAVDISTKHLGAAEKHRLISLIFRIGTFTGVGIGAGKLHVDVRDTPRPIFWYYS